jgi:Peroxidase
MDGTRERTLDKTRQTRPTMDKQRHHPYDDEEEGVEIALSASSQAKLQRRMERQSNRRMVGLPWTGSSKQRTAYQAQEEDYDGENPDTDEEFELPPPPPPPEPKVSFRVRVMGTGAAAAATSTVANSAEDSHSSLPPEVVKKLQVEERSRSRFRLLAVGLLIVCLIGIVVASVMAARAGRRNDSSAARAQDQQQATNNNNNSTSGNDVFQYDGAPSMTPTDVTGAGSLPSPTAATAAPTTPTGVVATNLRAVKSNYAFDEALTLFFAYGNDILPDSMDWIGIYPIADVPAEGSGETLGDATTFLFTCNQPSICNSVSIVGQVVFSEDQIASSSSVQEERISSWRWPLDPNDYQAFLIRGLEQPFQVLASSNVFTIKPDFMIHTVVPAVQAIEVELRRVIDNDPFMGPKFVRLGFHDCAGGCDGCVDMDFHDNAGLELPLEVLAPITQQHESAALGISRADIWALAALVAADVAQERSDTKVDFSLEYIGRKNCEDRFDACFDLDGNQRNCSATLGPFVELPMADITSDNLFHFFSNEFDFTVQETVALMGAHTLGRLHREVLGFDGPNGWVRDNLLLSNDYYHELMGGSSRDDDLETLIETAPDWFRFDIDNSDLQDIPDRHAWHAFPPAFDGSGTVEIVMLTADVSIVFVFVVIVVRRRFTTTTTTTTPPTV